MGVRERGAAQQEGEQEVGCEEKHSAQLQHSGDRQHCPCERKQSFVGQSFWARGFLVSTVSRDEAVVREYIRDQGKRISAWRSCACGNDLPRKRWPNITGAA